MLKIIGPTRSHWQVTKDIIKSGLFLLLCSFQLSPRTFTVDHLASSDITTSVLTFRPQAQDDGQELTCKAYNEATSSTETKEHGSLWPQWKREQHATTRRTGFANGGQGGFSNDWNPNELDNDEKRNGLLEPLGVSHSMTMQVRCKYINYSIDQGPNPAEYKASFLITNARQSTDLLRPSWKCLLFTRQLA